MKKPICSHCSYWEEANYITRTGRLQLGSKCSCVTITESILMLFWRTTVHEDHELSEEDFITCPGYA